MERSWWWKAFGLSLLSLATIFYLIPTFVDNGKLPAWYSKLVKSRLQLGLDLQGGIHLVYEVQIDKAVSDKADRLATDLEDRLRKEKQATVHATREGRDEIVLKFSPAASVKHVDKKFLDDYAGQLLELSRNESAGTSHLRIDEAYVDEVRDGAVAQAIEIIRGRVDEFGVAEPSIQRKGRFDIEVDLPGLTKEHFERVKNVIGRTAQLEFKIVDDESNFMEQVAAKVPKDGAIKVRTEVFDAKDRGATTYVYLESKDKSELENFIEKLPASGVTIPADRQIILGTDQATDDKGTKLPDKVWITYYVHRRTLLTGEYLTDAQVQWEEETQRPEVGLTFDHSGAIIFERISGDNIGRRMAIILDNAVNSAPVLQSRISGGRARITLGGLRAPGEIQKEAKDLAGVLRSGALPAPLKKTFERQVGPTLGRDAIAKGSAAFALGSGLVVLFMMYYYRGAGVICNIALVLNVLLILAVMAGLNATLTLPGIAGLVLTVGMAVDANVLVYERIREEAALGKSPRAAVEAGFGRAFWTIFDSHVTQLIAGVVLAQYGSGPVRGFAVTLIVGVFTSVFTAVFVSRFLFDFVLGAFKPKTLSVG